MASSYVESVAPEPAARPMQQLTIHPSAPEKPAKPERLVSLDAYRGFIMLVMASGGFGLPQVARQFPDSPIWKFLGYQFDHVAWSGCAFWDLIQPSFMFMVGVAMPYSYFSRRVQGESSTRMFAHTVYRSFVLVLLGVFLSSNWNKQTDFVFVNVLCQIGLGYTFVYLLLGRGFAVQLMAAMAILIGYWFFFILYQVPDIEYFKALGIPTDWEYITGFPFHFNKNANAAAAFDRWFLNLLPRPEEFKFNKGGYETLNFVPSMATMIFGMMAGELLRRSDRTKFDKFIALVLAGAVCLTIGWTLDFFGICPSVKRIWTPSWAIFSSGWTFWMLAAFYGIIDLMGFKAWSFALVVVGMNSIAMYCMSQLIKGWVKHSMEIHLNWGWNWLTARPDLASFWESLGVPSGQGIFGYVYGPIVSSVAALFILWLICLWMYRRKVFVRI